MKLPVKPHIHTMLYKTDKDILKEVYVFQWDLNLARMTGFWNVE